jgi:hypothetical protein
LIQTIKYKRLSEGSRRLKYEFKPAKNGRERYSIPISKSATVHENWFEKGAEKQRHANDRMI